MSNLEQAFRLYNQYMKGLNIDLILIIDEKSGLGSKIIIAGIGNTNGIGI